MPLPLDGDTRGWRTGSSFGIQSTLPASAANPICDVNKSHMTRVSGLRSFVLCCSFLTFFLFPSPSPASPFNSPFPPHNPGSEEGKYDFGVNTRPIYDTAPVMNGPGSRTQHWEPKRFSVYLLQTLTQTFPCYGKKEVQSAPDYSPGQCKCRAQKRFYINDVYGY